MAYIYQIRRRDTEQCYVGHTVKEVEVRWAAHLLLLGRNKHHSRYLQNAWNKYGAGEFDFELIEQCSDDDKLVREQFFIDTLESCFNTAKVAGSRIGVLYTEEQRIRLSAIRMGHPTTEEARHKIGEAHKGKQWKLGYKLTDEQRARCSAAQTGIARPYAAANAAIARIHSPANKPGWVPLHRIGMKDTEEVVERRRQSVIASLAERPLIWINDNVSERRQHADEPIPNDWYRGRLLSKEHVAAIRASNAKGKSDEAKANMSAARLRVLADPEKNDRIVSAIRPFEWWTDGTTSKRIPDGETPPDGWHKGRTMDAQKLIAGRTPGKPRKVRVPGMEPDVLAARMAAGESVSDIAADLGVHVASVHRSAKKGGRVAEPKPLTSEHIAVMQAARQVARDNTPTRVWITDGMSNRQMFPDKLIPAGWALGHTLSEEGRAATSAAAKAQAKARRDSRDLLLTQDLELFGD